MSDEDKDNIYKEDEVKVDENQPKDENKPSETESSDNIENKIDNKELTQSESNLVNAQYQLIISSFELLKLCGLMNFSYLEI